MNITSLNGLRPELLSHRFKRIMVQLHELLSFLNEHGVVTILVMAQYGILGGSMESPVDVSYLADTVILLRFFEAAGRVRKAISVVKKRSGGHEDTVRERKVGLGRILVGEPLTDFQGVLSGIPSYLGTAGRDSELIREARHGIRAERSLTVCELAAEIENGPGVVLIAEEALTRESSRLLTTAFENQPPWSELPVVVLSISGESTPLMTQRLSHIAPFGNVTLIERPVRPGTLVSVVQAALRATVRQYEVEGLLNRPCRASQSLATVQRGSAAIRICRFS